MIQVTYALSGLFTAGPGFNTLKDVWIATHRRILMCSALTDRISVETRTYRRAEREAMFKTLDIILASQRFESAPQMSAFLRFVVEKTAEGQQHRIKAFTVAVDALGKSPSFDPQNDPLVRVLAGRLRTALTEYNAENPDSDVKVFMAPGSYVPCFRFESTQFKKQSKARKKALASVTVQAPGAPQAVARNNHSPTVLCVNGPTVFVSAIETQQTLENSLNSLVSGVVAQCSTANAYRLFSSAPAAGFHDQDYLLSIKSMPLSQHLRICIQLLRACTGRIIDVRETDLSKTASESMSDEDLQRVIADVQAMLQPGSPLLNDYVTGCT